MIEQTTRATPEVEVALVLRPNRSLSRNGLFGFVAVQATVILAVAGYSARQGNVFAPVFALMQAAIVVLCWRLVWRRSAAGEVVSVGAERVEVVRLGARAVGEAGFRRARARVLLEPAARRQGDSRLLLGEPGKWLEIGAFLAEGERRALALRLRKLLAGGADAPPADG